MPAVGYRWEWVCAHCGGVETLEPFPDSVDTANAHRFDWLTALAKLTHSKGCDDPWLELPTSTPLT